MIITGSGTITSNPVVAVGAAKLATGAGSVVPIAAAGEIRRAYGDGGINQRSK
jgi:hypothetical protein